MSCEADPLFVGSFMGAEDDRGEGGRGRVRVRGRKKGEKNREKKGKEVRERGKCRR